ncbi:MAG TPA: Clp protease N-terminal domain-containing protein [Acidimicrobiales bacterium]|nr:Clp protease N-terminal domain-containing protein [Acidimicrobiales bacterium]
MLVCAQDEAQLLQHDFIGTEHLLLGVIAVDDRIVTQALAGTGVTLDEARERVAALIGPMSDEMDAGNSRPFTPRAKKVLELSLRETLALGHSSIEVAHVLLAILREGEGVGAQVLQDFGVDYDRTRMWVGQAMGEEPGFDVRGRRTRRRGRMRDLPIPRTPRLTGPAARVQDWAAGQPGQLGTHDLLLALFDDADSMAAQVLAAAGVTKAQVEAKVAEIGIENTSDAPPVRPPKPTSVTLAEGVEVRISDPDLAKLVESGQVEELLKEIVRRSKPAS